MIMLQELALVYMNDYPDSITALHLLACNMFRLTNDREAAVCYHTLSEFM